MLYFLIYDFNFDFIYKFLNRENVNIMIVFSLIATKQIRTKISVLMDAAYLYWHFLLLFLFFLVLTLTSIILYCYTCVFPLQLCRFLIFALSFKKVNSREQYFFFSHLLFTVTCGKSGKRDTRIRWKKTFHQDSSTCVFFHLR